VLLERGQARVFTRDGYDWSDRYPSIVRAAADLRCKSAIIDGEAIVQNGEGASDFEALQSAIRWQPHSIILYAFDLMHLDGKDLCQQALSERRSILKALIGSDEESRIQFSETGAMRTLLAKADGHALSYAGAAFIGLSSDAWSELLGRLQQLAIRRTPLDGLRLKDAQWVEPKLTARVRHLAGAKYLRHAVVKTLL
jgi:ATP-dependent DNA ligase